MNSVEDINPGCNDFGGRDTDGAAEELDAMYAAWERQQNADAVADADEQQATAAMADVDAEYADDDDAELDEAIRIAREEADAAEYEYQRLVAYQARRAVTTEARIASGNLDIMAAVCGTLGERRAS